jgi:hypothetical protein
LIRGYNDETIEADHSGQVLRVRVLRLSINYSVFVKELPSRLDWQKYLDDMEIPIKLLKSLEVSAYSGFVPMKLANYNAGVEIYLDEVAPGYTPEIKSQLGDRAKIVIFSFGGDEAGACCTLGAAAALAKFADGLVYSDGFLSVDEALTEFKALLPEAKKKLSQTPNRKLLASVSKELSHFAKKGNTFFYLPIGQCARGFIVNPDSDKYFEVRLLLSPLFKPADRFGPASIPKHLGILCDCSHIYQPSTGLSCWSYENPGSCQELVDLATNKLEPYFDSINDPPGLADDLLKTFCNSRNIHDLEATGLACAAAGKHEEALSMFDRVMEQSQPHLRFDWVKDLEERCTKIATFIKEKRTEELAKQLAEWQTYTVKESGIAALVKKSC